MSTVSESKRHLPRTGLTPGLGDLFAPLPPEPLVSIVMTTYNSEATLEAAVRSLMEQTYRNIEIIVSDDGSSDGTIELVQRLCVEDRRISLLQFGGNHGTYWAKNYGLLRSRGPVVTFADSDDTSDPRRIELQLAALRAPGVAVSTCAYSRVDAAGAQLSVPGSRGFAFISQMIRRDVLEMVGFFDSARTSADDELLNRILISFGAAAHSIVSERLYTAVVREGSLSHNKDNPRYSPVTKGLSPPRRAYAEGFRAWHARVLASGALPYIPFPVTTRPFPLDPKLEVRQGHFARNFISVVAWGSGPDAESRLSGLARQCARDTTCARSWLDAPGLEGELWKIHRVSSEAEARDLARAARFPSGYVVFCDLDGSAPAENFLQRAVLEVERANRPGVSAVLAQPAPSEGRTALHGHGGHTEAQAGPAPAEDQSTASAPGRRSRADKPVPASRSDTTGPTGADMRAEAARPGRVKAAFRDGIPLFKQFLGLWSRSEQAIAVLICAGFGVILLGLVTGWGWIATLGIAGMLGGIGLAVLFNTRRTRLLADPALQMDSQQRLSSLRIGLASFRHTHLGRGPTVMARVPAAAAEPAAGMEPAAAVAASPAGTIATPPQPSAAELLQAVRQVRGASPAAGLAVLSQIQSRFAVSADLGYGLTALRVLLLVQAGRKEVAERELSRLFAGKGNARKWAERGRAWIDDKRLSDDAVDEVVEEILGGLEVRA